MLVNEGVTVSGVPSRADLIVFAGMQKGATHVAEGAPTDQFHNTDDGGT